MFDQWGQERFVDYMRAHHGVDALDSFDGTGDDSVRTVPEPAERTSAMGGRRPRQAPGR